MEFMTKFILNSGVCVALYLALSACSPADETGIKAGAPGEVPVSTTIVGPVTKLNIVSGGVAPENFRVAKGDFMEAKGGALTLTSTVLNPASSKKTGASYFIIPESFEASARGKLIKIIVSARASSNKPAQQFGLSYSTAWSGNSGWKYYTIDSEFKSYELTYQVSDSQEATNLDYIGLHADKSGAGNGIELQSLTVEIVTH